MIIRVHLRLLMEITQGDFGIFYTFILFLMEINFSLVSSIYCVIHNLFGYTFSNGNKFILLSSIYFFIHQTPELNVKQTCGMY